MNPYIEKLEQQIADNPPNFGDADSVLGHLYECFKESGCLSELRSIRFYCYMMTANFEGFSFSKYTVRFSPLTGLRLFHCTYRFPV